MNDAIQRAINNILLEMRKPENFNLAIAVRDYKGEDGFMFGFAEPFSEASSFEDFADWTRIIDTALQEGGLDIEPVVDMSKAYDDYLEHRQQAREQSGLTKNMADHWNAIVDKYDEGWTGAMYGFICRGVQSAIRKAFEKANNN